MGLRTCLESWTFSTHPWAPSVTLPIALLRRRAIRLALLPREGPDRLEALLRQVGVEPVKILRHPRVESLDHVRQFAGQCFGTLRLGLRRTPVVEDHVVVEVGQVLPQPL